MKSVAVKCNTVLEWKCTVDRFVSRHEARVTSSAKTEDYLKIEYVGWANTESQTFSGSVTLHLSTVECGTQGEGKLGNSPAPFRLVGAFQNEDFTIYEGTWYEDPDYVATFSFDASV